MITAIEGGVEKILKKKISWEQLRGGVAKILKKKISWEQLVGSNWNLIKSLLGGSDCWEALSVSVLQNMINEG